MGRAYKETVPYSRPLTQGAFITPSPNPADYTLTSYDALGRIYQVQAPDGSIQTSVYSLQSDNGALYNLTHLTNRARQHQRYVERCVRSHLPGGFPCGAGGNLQL